MCIDSPFFNTLLDRCIGVAAKGVNVTVSQNDIAEASKLGSLERLRKKIGQHFKRRAMSDLDSIGLCPVLDPEISYVDVP